MTLPISAQLRSSLFFGLLLGSTFVGSAQAEETFPGFVRDHLQMACTPKCSLCHEKDAPTAPPNLSKPFVASLTQSVVADKDSLVAALDGLGTTDSDQDGVADLVELKDNNTATAMPGMAVHLASDPNVAGAGEICASSVNYGCGSKIAEGPAPKSNLEAVATVFLLAGAGLWIRRYRFARGRAA